MARYTQSGIARNASGAPHNADSFVIEAMYVILCLTTQEANNTVGTYTDGQLYGPLGGQGAFQRAVWHFNFTIADFPKDAFALYQVTDLGDGQIWKLLATQGAVSAVQTSAGDMAISMCNDALQAATDLSSAYRYVCALTPALLQGVADLNGHDNLQSRGRLIKALMSDKF